MEHENKSKQHIAAIPVGVEVLVKKASVDPEFRQILLEKRGEAAGEIGLELTEAERKMLSSIAVEQLEKIIDNTKVKPEHRNIFRGKAIKLMLGAAAGLVVVSMMSVKFTAGISPDRVRKMQIEDSSDANDVNEPNEPDIDSEGLEQASTRSDEQQSGEDYDEPNRTDGEK
ncbi:MAG TPA: hypothetical protein VMW72_08790 [Sedimentisphaerales bacterium]|nr:hypothetical protein [Sedimentisphaerales bacterium]